MKINVVFPLTIYEFHWPFDSFGDLKDILTNNKDSNK
jgi:hypothetical protein